MRLSLQFAAISLGILAFASILPAGSPEPSSKELAEAKKTGWDLAILIIKTLEDGDQTEFPGIQAWLKDFHDLTKGTEPKVAREKRPAPEIDSLTAQNPNFWRAYYEIAPGDAGLTVLHSGLLLAGGEATRASYVIEMSRHGPASARDKDVETIFNDLQGATQLAGKQSRSITEEGVKLHDAADYAGAIKKYKEALAVWPQNGWTHYELGFTLRTQLEVAAGRKPDPHGTVRINEKPIDSAEVKAEFAEARKRDPLQYMAYQGTDQEVIRGLMSLVKKVKPTLEKMRTVQEDATVDALLPQLAEGFQEANIHELALTVRQIMVARRGRYDPSDHPFIATSLRKIAPGPATEEALKRLMSRQIKLRQLMPPAG